VKAAVLRDYSRPLEVGAVREPEPREGEVLVKVRATGLCGTDLKLNAGAFSHVRLPVIPGHEVAGQLVDPVDGMPSGQPVACYMYEYCGKCRPCRLGLGPLCRSLVRIGIERDGGMAEYMAVSRENVFPFDDRISFGAAAVAMDSVMTPWQALHRRGQVQAGDRVLVVGAGGLGLNAVQIATAAGARVAVVDPIASHRERAAELGAESTFPPEQVDDVRAWGDDGVDLAVDTSGAESGFDNALASVRPGGRVVCCGYQVGKRYAFESSRTVLEEISIMGARVGLREDAAPVLREIEEGRIHPTVMEELSLEDVNHALERLAGHQVVGRLVIAFPG